MNAPDANGRRCLTISAYAPTRKTDGFLDGFLGDLGGIRHLSHVSAHPSGELRDRPPIRFNR